MSSISEAELAAPDGAPARAARLLARPRGDGGVVGAASGPALERDGTLLALLGLVLVLTGTALLAPGGRVVGLVVFVPAALLALALLGALDGFPRDLFSSCGRLERSLAAAGFAGAALALAVAPLWPALPAPLVVAELVLGLAVAARAITSSAPVLGRRTARARALVVSAGPESRLGDSLAELGAGVDVAGHLTLADDGEAVERALALHRPALLLVDAPLSDLDFGLLRVCSERSVRVLVLLRPAYGLAVGGRIVRLGGLPWLALRPFRLGRRHRLPKRALDLVLVFASLPALVPLTAGIAVAIAVTSRGGVLYRQTRVGERGRPFVLLKFRTMELDAERETGPVLADADDPRVTAVGRVLRRLRFDELPQLWNVVRGEMSLVGPRPERPELFGCFHDVPAYEHRHLLRPGLTGLAQLVGGYAATPADKVRCDLLYVTSRSLTLDLRLIATTLVDLVRGFPGG